MLEYCLKFQSHTNVWKAILDEIWPKESAVRLYVAGIAIKLENTTFRIFSRHFNFHARLHFVELEIILALDHVMILLWCVTNKAGRTSRHVLPIYLTSLRVSCLSCCRQRLSVLTNTEKLGNHARYITPPDNDLPKTVVVKDGIFYQNMWHQQFSVNTFIHNRNKWKISNLLSTYAPISHHPHNV